MKIKGKVQKMNITEENDTKDPIINHIFNMFLEYIEGGKLPINGKTENSENSNKILYEKIFAKILCCSCVGNMRTLFESFKEIYQQQEKLDSEIVDLDKLFSKKSESEQKLRELKETSFNTNELYQVVSCFYDNTLIEYKRISEDAQLKETQQLKSKTKKGIDKTERVNQLIIHDLQYFIDNLNRKILMGKGQK